MIKKNMIKSLFFITCLYLHLAAFADTTSLKKGILRVELNKLENGAKLNIYNNDSSVFASVYRDPDSELIKIQKADRKQFVDIRSFDEDYGLMIFDADSMGKSFYPIYIGNLVKYIKAEDLRKGIVYFQSWNVFIKTVFVKVPESSSVYIDTVAFKKINKAEQYSYSVKKVAGDWLYVECLKQCEQCPAGRVIRGWIRWRKANKLLVEIYYFC